MSDEVLLVEDFEEAVHGRMLISANLEQAV
jgi:hypothetical protein